MATDAAQMAKITCTPTGSGQRVFTTENNTHHHYLCGLEVTPNQGSAKLSGLVNFGTPSVDQTGIEPHDIVLDRCYVHGLTTGNYTRIGIALHSKDTAIINSTSGRSSTLMRSPRQRACTASTVLAATSSATTTYSLPGNPCSSAAVIR
jgi:hypothetical protein